VNAELGGGGGSVAVVSAAPKRDRWIRSQSVAKDAMTKERDERGGWSERLAVAGAGALHGAAGVFSFAPFGQFYLAWVAVAALLWATVAARTTRGAVASAYLAGLCYFGGNLW